METGFRIMVVIVMKLIHSQGDNQTHALSDTFEISNVVTTTLIFRAKLMTTSLGYTITVV